MIHFLNITIQSKGADDWRAFLDWADSETMMRYQLRGYGATPGQAADDAWLRYSDAETREFNSEDAERWI